MKYIKLNKGYEAIVDDEDYEKLCKYTWFVRIHDSKKQIYAERWGTKNQRHVHMHREIMQPNDNQQVDHINHNGLDNRKTNLRVCEQSQNQANSNIRIDNTSGYKGVTWHKKTQKWAAQIQIHKKRKHLGLFLTAEEAAKTYDKAAIMYFKDFAKTNKEILGEVYRDEK